ncbi:MAG: tetratricopeptide repeat protein [Anaerolineales bacterium]|nr:tetratricopeptide repeat protein [Anaerolineales bacterium]
MSMPLLTAKLQPPRPPVGRLTRPRLLAQLEAGLARPVTLVSAPAGYGKTTLLAEWAAASGRPLAWLTLDRDDNDPARCLAYLIEALRQIQVDLGAETLAALRAQPTLPVATLLAPLLNELAALPQDGLLVLDDYHLIEAQPVHTAVTFLIEHQPPALHVALGTRADPPLPIARLRARGQLTEVRQTDLCFTIAEAEALLRHITGGELAAGPLAALLARTEGWAAGLQMAGASLRGRDAARAEAFIQAFTGTHRHVLDYLMEEVLGRLPPELHDFLLRTAILERLSGPLCAAVLAEPGTDGPAAANRLRQLERANLFITGLDDGQEWYRYHPLFAELLNFRLRQADPSLPPVLHRRAAVWCGQHGLAVEAVRHALAAGDVDGAADLIEQAIPDAWRAGEIATWAGWLKALPDEVRRRRPGLCLYTALGELLEARTLTGVEALLQQAADLDPPGHWRGEISALRGIAAIMHGDLAGGRALCESAAQALPETSPLRGLVNRTLSTVLFLAGDLAGGCERLEADVLASQRLGDRLGAAASLRRLGTLHFMLGRLRHAHAFYQESLAVSRDAAGRPWPVAGRALIHLGELAYEWNDLATAGEQAAEGIELLEELLPAWALTGHLLLARVKQALGDAGGADAAVSAAAALARATETRYDNALVALAEVRLALERGQIREAERHWAAAVGPGAGSTDSEAILSLAYLRELQQLVGARLDLQRGQPEAALQTLAPIAALAEQQGRSLRLVEALVLQAQAYAALGQTAAAQAALQRALAQAEPEGLVRTFVDEGAPLRALLTHGPAAEPAGLAAYRSRLLTAFGTPHPPAPPPTSQPAMMLVEPLSERELSILRLIAEGGSNRDIAQKLYLSLYTVKFYTYTLFGKLGVHSRTQAVARARDLGLLAES